MGSGKAAIPNKANAQRMLVIWDIDGTLADTTTAIKIAQGEATRWLQARGFKAPEPETWNTLRTLSHGNVATICALVAIESGVAGERRQEFADLYTRILLDAIKPVDHAIDVLRHVEKSGGVNAVSSVGDAWLQHEKLKRIGADSLIAESLICVFPAGDGAGKPSGAPVLELRRRSGVTGRVWVVGNGLDDIASATAAGARSICITDNGPDWPAPLPKVLTPTHLVHGLADAEHLVCAR